MLKIWEKGGGLNPAAVAFVGVLLGWFLSFALFSFLCGPDLRAVYQMPSVLAQVFCGLLPLAVIFLFLSLGYEREGALAGGVVSGYLLGFTALVLFSSGASVAMAVLLLLGRLLSLPWMILFLERSACGSFRGACRAFFLYAALTVLTILFSFWLTEVSLEKAVILM